MIVAIIILSLIVLVQLVFVIYLSCRAEEGLEDKEEDWRKCTRLKVDLAAAKAEIAPLVERCERLKAALCELVLDREDAFSLANDHGPINDEDEDEDDE